ncbi:MAG: isochorismate synthase [Byssovorax sp.]
MNPLDFLLAAIDAIEADPSIDLGVIAVPAPLVDPDDLLDRVHRERASGEPLLLWDAPSREPGREAHTFLGWGEAARIEGHGDARFTELRDGARALFASITEHRHPALGALPSVRLFGGLSFRPELDRPAAWVPFGDASFALPRWLYARAGDQAFLRLAVRRGEPLARASIEAAFALLGAPDRAAPPAEPPAPRDVAIDRPSPASWGALVDDALARIRAHELEKVVPAALCHVASSRDLDAAAALRRVHAAYPECARFAFQRGGGTFLGASPERLVARTGDRVEVDGLAGSRGRGRTPEADARAASALLASDKDRREHALVVQAIERALAPLARRVDVPSTPVLRSLHNVHHLWTPIHAVIDRPTHVLDLVELLHPTPAVCGAPRPAAIAWIAAHEPMPRGWYAGAVGWLDAHGDGDFAVAIRSGLLAGREAWLYAGAGIVEGSDPGAEYAETGIKHGPMLAALGVVP